MLTLSVKAADWNSILPALALVAAALAAVGLQLASRPEKSRGRVEFVAYAGLLGALGLVVWRLWTGGGRQEGFGGAVVLDDLALFLSLSIVAATGLTVVLSADYLRDREAPHGEYHALLLLAAAGMILLVQSQDLVTFFVSLEILSLSLYTLSGLFRRDPRSNEAAIKYFVMGAFATGFLLYGMALLYGATGSATIPGIAEGLRRGSPPASLVHLGFALLAVGLAFKVGAAPFHVWVPDVYEGAPASVTAFMSVAVKAAGFGALVRILLSAGWIEAEAWGNILRGLALVTLVAANLVAVWQASVKRMLAYSSVAHTGYVLVAVASMRNAERGVQEEAAAAAVFYLFVYTFMTLGAFAFVIWAGKGGKDAEDIEDYAGLAKRRPWAAFLMTVFMLSLAGIPPTAGFLGKFLLFKAAIRAGEIPLVVTGVLASAVSVYYYLRVVVAMYMHPAPAPSEEKPALNAGLVVTFAAVFTVALGILPSRFLEFASRSVRSFLP
jgi:NADH-quinone oxidoreductase subunit N